MLTFGRSIFEPFKEGQYVRQVTPSDASDSIPSVFDYIDYEFTEEGVWQAFLLYISWQYMPIIWHGGYDQCNYIFTMEDAEDIRRKYKSKLILRYLAKNSCHMVSIFIC